MKKFLAASAISLLAVIATACSDSEESMGGHDMSNMNHDTQQEASNDQETKSDGQSLPNTIKTAVKTGNGFTITAKEAVNQFNSKTSLPVWTFDGSVPGSQIRVKEGEKVKVNLKNELSEPVTIHWHGVPVPNDQDGIPGVTMNAVQPGETFTYEFVASVPGTYWYHSHQDSVNQIDKGLYGTFIVEAKEENVDKDYTLVLDEWISSSEETMEGMDHDMEGMDHSSMGSSSEENGMEDMNHSNMNMQGHDMTMYDLYTINGKSGESTEALKVSKGDKVKIRLVNAGYMSHKIHLHGHDFKITSTDGQPIQNPAEIKDQLVTIAPGERYDLEFTADNPGTWFIESHDENEAAKNMAAKIVYDGTQAGNDKQNYQDKLPEVDVTAYGKNSNGLFSLQQKYDVEYTMDLGTAMNDQGMVYTINGKTFPDTEPLNVKKDDLIKVTLKNTSPMDDHPMHLHGHFFQVLSKNGQPIQGSPLMKDTLNLKPGEEYVVAFKADNPGNWMFHCHDLHHASAGMVTELKYTDYQSDFIPDPNANNMPE